MLTTFASLRMFYRLLTTLAAICILSSTLLAAPKSGFNSFIVGNAADAAPSPNLTSPNCRHHWILNGFSELKSGAPILVSTGVWLVPLNPAVMPAISEL
jgi:hypothetical protein